MSFPPVAHLQELLDQCRPLSVLRELQGEIPVELTVYKAQACLFLDQVDQASALLEPALQCLHGDDLARARRYWSQILLSRHKVDEAILSAQLGIQAAETNELRAYAMIDQAAGYSLKMCQQLAQNLLQAAKALVGPDDPMILLGEAHLLLDSDERLAAREKFDRLAECDVTWAKHHASRGQGIVALLLGDFEQACNRANACLQISDEMIWPYFLLVQLAGIDEDSERIEQILNKISELSPTAESLETIQSILQLLKERNLATNARRRRLKAFPTTMQKRNHCGPSTIDLILRFWKSSQEFTDDQIAAFVKLPRSGTPMYRMQEFFHLAGFDTVRCQASIPDLKRLIDAGYPVIVQEEFPDNAHVTVVVGYDEASHVIEFQDPMTHEVIAIPEEAVNQVRKTYLDAAITAFPQGQGHEKELARLGFFDELALIWTDQAQSAMDRGGYQEAASLVERAVQRLPDCPISWIVWLSAALQSWESSLRQSRPSIWKRMRSHEDDPARSRKRFFEILGRARELFPESKFMHGFSGSGALQDGDLKGALASYKRASEIDPDDSRNYAARSECHFKLRESQQALEMAREALRRNPTLPGSNIWMARCLAASGDQAAEHYARCALELAPDWWLTHQAMAEVHLLKKDPQAARRELDLAIAMDPLPTEPRIQRALLAFEAGYTDYAFGELERTLKSPVTTPLYAGYQARQAICRTFFSSKKFDEAQKQVRRLLKLTPQDPWALQFLAAATSESLSQKKSPPGPAARQIRELYAIAIPANQGVTWVVEGYLIYLSRFVILESILEEISTLCSEYPKNKSLLVQHACWMRRAGRYPEAARLMIEAVRTPGGIRDGDDLYNAVLVMLDGLGVEGTERELLSFPDLDGVPPLAERQRALGLELGTKPKEHGAHASELLRKALEHNPRDAYAMLRLGDLTEDPQEREDLYRRALQQEPGRPDVRAHLAEYLIDTGRAREALCFTESHNEESPEIMIASGRALSELGRYDEAVIASRAVITRVERPESWMFENLWYAESQSGDHAAALNTSRAALHLFPTEVKWYVLGARSLRNQGRFFQASRTIQRGTLVGLNYTTDLESQYESALARGRYRAALRAQEKLSKWEKPGDEKYLTRSEQRHLRVLLKLGRTREAQEMLDARPGFDSAEAWRGAILICLEAAAWDLAGELARRALAYDPQDWTALFAPAESVAETGHPDQAISIYQAACAADPYEHRSYEKLAIHHAMSGRLEEAVQMAERAVLLGPSCPLAWGTRGYVHFLKGQWQSARSDLEMGWKRATYSQRHEQFVFWWLLAALQTRPLLALYRQVRALREAHTGWQSAQVSQVGSQVNHLYRERLRYPLSKARFPRALRKS